LQCVAVWCSVLQCGAVCCSVVQCGAVCCSVLQCVIVCCSVVQCVAVWCSVVQHGAVCCSVLHRVVLERHLALIHAQRYQKGMSVCCSVVQCGAVWCSVVQCGAVCCSVCCRGWSVKRDPPQRHELNVLDQQHTISRCLYSRQKRPAKETYINQKRPIQLPKRHELNVLGQQQRLSMPIFASKETRKRDLHTSQETYTAAPAPQSQCPWPTRLCSSAHKNCVTSTHARDLHKSKETHKRDLHTSQETNTAAPAPHKLQSLWALLHGLVWVS